MNKQNTIPDNGFCGNPDDCANLAEGFFKSLCRTNILLEKYKDSISGVPPRNDFVLRDGFIQGFWFRTYLLMNSLERLNSPTDFQTHSAINRTLFEITVDLSLLYGDKSSVSGWKMRWWGLSEKLKNSENLINYYANTSGAKPNAVLEAADFLSRNKDEILVQRSKIWNSDSHPNRWTGHSLFDDLADANLVENTSFNEILGMSLEEYYRNFFHRQSWNIHSSTNSFANLPTEAFSLISAFSLDDSVKFALICTRIVLDDFGLSNHLPNLSNDWQNMTFDNLQLVYESITK